MTIKPPLTKQQQSFRARLALSTALAGAVFLYSGRAAYAGSCTGSGGVYSCSGGATGGDVQQFLPLSGTTPLTVTTTDNFGISTSSGQAFTLYGTGGISFNTGPNASITGNGSGIFARNFTSGSTSVTTTGLVTGNNADGITANNFNAGTTDLTVSANDVTGNYTGILALNSGTGALTVTSTGTATGGTDYSGIQATNTTNGTSLTISAVNANGGFAGIRARNLGSGNQSVTVTGTVTGGFGQGIRTQTDGGSGTTSITLNSGADVSASSGNAIFNDGGDSTTIVNSGGTVTGTISLGGGADSLTFDGGSFLNVTSFDGGTGGDSLTFRNVTGNVAGGTVVGMESVTVGNGGNISVSGTLDVDGAFVLDGGTLNAGTVNGDITMSNGTLSVETVNGNVIVSGGTLSPGNSPGLTSIVGDLDLGVSSTTLLELGGLIAGTEYDRIDVSDDPGTGGTIEGIATLAAGAIFDIDFFGAFAASLGDSFDVLIADDIVGDINTLTFEFTGASLGAGLDWNTSFFFFSGGANDGREALRLSVVSSETFSVPAPSSLPLFASLLGLIGLGRARRRRKAR
jgi:autotransporter family porin